MWDSFKKINSPLKSFWMFSKLTLISRGIWTSHKNTWLIPLWQTRMLKNQKLFNPQTSISQSVLTNTINQSKKQCKTIASKPSKDSQISSHKNRTILSKPTHPSSRPMHFLNRCSVHNNLLPIHWCHINRWFVRPRKTSQSHSTKQV